MKTDVLLGGGFTPNRRVALGEMAIATCAGLLGTTPFAAFAQSSARSVGNYPAGVGKDSVFVGIVVPLTGPYASEGGDEKRGYELAIEQINSGDPVLRQFSPRLKKGVLGRQIRYDFADGQTKPNSAVQAVERFIDQDKAIMVTGAVSSAVSVALNHVLNSHRILYIANFGSSNTVTGKDCVRYGFRLLTSVYSMARAVMPVAVEQLGKDHKAAYLVPDYTYGHTLYHSTREIAERAGWKTVATQLHSLGATDYSAYLVNIANSGADVFVDCDYGADATNSIKQAKGFGVLRKMSTIVPQLSPFLADAVGPDTMQGILGYLAYWWTLENKYSNSKSFVSAFRKKYNDVPRGTAALAYLNTIYWADAVERTGSFDPVAVIKQYETGTKMHGFAGDIWFRATDHQGIFNFPILRGKKASQMKDSKDFYEVVKVIDGNSAVQPETMFGCKLGVYE